MDTEGRQGCLCEMSRKNPMGERRTTGFLVSFGSPVADLLILTLRATRRDHVSELVVITMGRWRKARTWGYHAAQSNAGKLRLRYAIPEEATSITELHDRIIMESH